ncbi:hypothetical protein GCM10010320_45810 [Streptomyces caelestis]|uniref:Uncharacterized protein n=1 Tax=Streptomyces caelestis TaxID=36816 RepID=A0A7W9LTJ3_9ACTN|nr:hypothetical protein [Streptomyces caelestis]GGW59772.1 hypothetical protein GCM10010320_45810 [Streptomyces caelestis]
MPSSPPFRQVIVPASDTRCTRPSPPGHNTLALTAGAAALACAALVLWLTRTGRRQHPAPQAPKPEQDTHSVD